MHLNIVLPVGISFYIFKAISYISDVYHGKIHADRSFNLFALYVAFFPQLLAGPIEKAGNLLPQFRKKSDFVPLAIDNFERIDESIVTDSVKVSYLERIAQEHRPGCLLVYTISPTYRHVDIKAYKAVRDICSRYHIPLLDYENDDRFLGQYDLFYDGSHLNDKGAELYSSIVACDIKTLIREKE